MSTPLNASYRIEFQITVDGLLHKLRHYCGVVPSADPTGYDLQPRAPGANFGASLGIDRMWTLLAGIYSATAASFGQAIIQQRSGGAWLPVAAYTTAVVPAAAGTYGKAYQLTMSMRDTAFHKVRAILLETGAAPGQKTTIPTGFGGGYSAWATAYTSAGLIANHDPYHWVRGRSDLYLGSWVSMVTDLNDKVRRARGIM